MARNKIEDLNNHLFEVLEKLNDEHSLNEMTEDQKKDLYLRAKLVGHIGAVLVKSADVQVKFRAITGNIGGSSMLQIQENND